MWDEPDLLTVFDYRYELLHISSLTVLVAESVPGGVEAFVQFEFYSALTHSKLQLVLLSNLVVLFQRAQCSFQK